MGCKGGFDSFVNDRAENFAEGVTESCMSNYFLFFAKAEEARPSNALGSVNDLGRNDEVFGCNLFAQRADSTESQDGFDTEVFESGNVGEVRDVGRQDRVFATMTSEEGDVITGRSLGDSNGRGRGTPRGGDVDFGKG